MGRKQQKKHLSRKSTQRHPRVLVQAKFSGTTGAFGFAVPFDAADKRRYKDIFIPAHHVNGAIEGDTVTVEIINTGDERGAVGMIAAVDQRTRQYIVAELTGRNSARPMDRHLPEEVRVTKLPPGAATGDWVKLKLLNTGSRNTNQLRTEVADVIGHAGNAAHDLAAVMAEFHLEENPYSETRNRAAARLTETEIPRESMVRAFTVTVDPADAHDFDDAVSISEDKDGKHVTLGVHIADVAAFIRPGSTFDKEAFKRGFSAYIPGMFMPMLPKTLTAKISLREGEISPAHSVIFVIAKSTGKIKSVRRVHTRIKVNKRLDYGTVQAFLDSSAPAPKDWTPGLKKNLKLLADIARKLRNNRRKTEKYLDMPLPEVRVTVDPETLDITGIERKMQAESDNMIEEFMLAANSAVAEELIGQHIPGLFRIHPEPDPEKIQEFEILCMESFGFSPGDILSSRIAVTHFLENLPQDHRKSIILSQFLRSLNRASYGAEPGLHYGLGKLKYSHFTSPIRRYPDLLTHQQLWNKDTGARLKNQKKMEEIAIACSELEENNDNAYFAANDRMKIHYLKNSGALENGSIWEAVIVQVKSAGLVCSIDELGLYGFIPRENLRGGAFRRQSAHRQKMIAAQGHKSYRVGDFIYVALDSIDLIRGNALFRPAL